jgi:hypothetical protein
LNSSRTISGISITRDATGTPCFFSRAIFERASPSPPIPNHGALADAGPGQLVHDLVGEGSRAGDDTDVSGGEERATYFCSVVFSFVTDERALPLPGTSETS